MFDRRLIAAEVLKLRRRRGMLSVSLLLTLGVIVLAFGVMVVQHAVDPAQWGPAGGSQNYEKAIGFTGLIAFAVGAIIGATGGTQDLESGVFRDLAATGRSRLALFASRVGGAWVVVLAIVGLTAVVAGMASVALAGSLGAPDTGALIAGTVGVLVAGAFSAAVAIGLSVLVGSRGPVIGIMLAFYFAVSPLLLSIGFLGDARQAIPEVAVSRIGDLPASGDVHIALVTAILVILAWTATALGLGAWRTTTREIQPSIMVNETPPARRYLLHHRHDADECGVAFASFKGHSSPLRHSGTVASCRSGGHAIWWVVDAPSPEAALALLPFFVAERSTAAEITEVTIP